ncbi:MAG: TlpA family protein disulfide reductase [Blastocatellia bacterium]|nr:TlpA family protein disulfide reductase [Blastocatellia bacterium]
MQATLTRLDGSSLKLEDYRGKVLVVNVWATWCGPCRHEIPELIKLQDKHKAGGFEVIGLNLDEDEDAELIKEFAKEFNINYELLRGNHELFGEFYRVSKRDAIPQSFLIDREGKLLGVFVGGGSGLKKLIESVDKVVSE